MRWAEKDHPRSTGAFLRFNFPGCFRRQCVIACLAALLICIGVGFHIDAAVKRKRKAARYPVEALRALGTRGVFIDSLLDVGANNGGWSQDMKEFALPDASFFLIEGNRAFRPALQERGFPYRIALVGDAEKDVTFFKLHDTGPSAGGNSIFLEATKWGPYYRNVTEHMITIDQVVKEEGLKDIAMIKLDIQGAELVALQGATDTLRTVKVIHLEVSTVPYNAGAPLIPEVLAFMDRLGFRLFSITDIFYRNGMTIQLDAFFVRSTLSEVWDDPPWK